MASGAGLNRVGQLGGLQLLRINSSATAVSTPLAGYGTIGLNDSGLQMLEAMGFSKWAFNLIGDATGLEVTLYGTLDPAGSKAWQAANYGPAMFAPSPGPPGSTIVPASSWFMLPAPSEQSGTGMVANPMTADTPLLTVSMPLVAVRAVVTTTAGTNGDCTVLGFALP